MALGARYTLFPNPNYALCTDPDDKIQLTDGKSTTRYFWTQKGTVGWQGKPYVLITVDLGRVRPIQGVAFTTAAGRAGVLWPASIRILLSDDGKAFYDAGDLVALDHKTHGPWPKDYAIRRLATTELRGKGRYVRFLAQPSGPYIFCDEVEVFEGPAELLQAAHAGEPIVDIGKFYRQGRVRTLVKNRWQADVASLRQAIDDAGAAAANSAELRRRLDAVQTQLEREEPTVDANFRAVLPIGAAHARLFQIQADLWKALGAPSVRAANWGIVDIRGGPVILGDLALSVWTANPWDPLDPFAAPPKSPAASLEIHAMRGEYRAAAFNLANATQQTLRVQINMEGLPGGPTPGYVTLHEVPWTDSSAGHPVAAALPEVRPDPNGWVVTVVPGLVRQVWLTFHPTDLPAGDYQARLRIRPSQGSPVVAKELASPAGGRGAGGEGGDWLSLPLPLHLRIWPMEFPKTPTLRLGGWCYTNGRGQYGITAENREPLLRHLQEHFVNCPWAGASVMMQCKFASHDPTQVELDTREFDDWIAQWPHAAQYRVFLSVGSSLGGAKMGTAKFEQRVGAWISAWVRHLAGKAVAPERLALLVHDEPHEATDTGPLVAWARAIHAAEPRVMIWEDPTYRDLSKLPPDVCEVSTVLCPNRPMWLADGKRFEEFYRRQQAAGRVLEFYSCSGPARALDPYSYYRLQAWHCWQIGAVGSSFWAFADNSGASSWNEYLVSIGPFTPLFLDQRTVTAGKAMEAIRESVEDYETLAMLQKAVGRANGGTGVSPVRDAAAVGRAESLLSTAASDVLAAAGADKLLWKEPKDRGRADAVRVKLLEALESLSR
jgi:hypothetical protein